MIPIALIGVFMQGRTHILAGVAVGLVMASGLEIAPALGVVAAAALGALLPDIDHPKSIIGRRAGLVGGVVRLGVAHRGALHSGLAAALVFLGASALPADLRVFGVAFAGGYASHLVLDMMTGAGVPLFWPHKQRISLLPIRTGGLVEFVFMLGLLVGIGWMVWSNF